MTLTHHTSRRLISVTDLRIEGEGGGQSESLSPLKYQLKPSLLTLHFWFYTTIIYVLIFSTKPKCESHVCRNAMLNFQHDILIYTRFITTPTLSKSTTNDLTWKRHQEKTTTCLLMTLFFSFFSLDLIIPYDALNDHHFSEGL